MNIDAEAASTVSVIEDRHRPRTSSRRSTWLLVVVLTGAATAANTAWMSVLVFAYGPGCNEWPTADRNALLGWLVFLAVWPVLPALLFRARRTLLLAAAVVSAMPIYGLVTILRDIDAYAASGWCMF